MTASLDDPAVRQRLDTDGTYERIHGLPEQCLEAWQASKDLSLDAGYRIVDKLVVAGMGGSAIAGDFFQAITQGESPIAVTVVRGYDLPAWVDGRTLVIACSHSGNTEETLSVFEKALQTSARKLAITTGGRLGELAEAKGVPTLAYTYPNVPRDAFGHGFIRLLAVGRALGMLEVDDERIGASVGEMQRQRQAIEDSVSEPENPAKKTARSFEEVIPLTIGAGIMTPVARRWRTQMNENADVFAFWDELPELDHNLVVGLRHPAELLKSTRPVFLDHGSLHPRVRLRYDLTIEIFEGAGIRCQRIVFPQADPLAAQLCALHFGDFVSYYLAMLKGTRPVEIDSINWLKEQLASRPVG